MPLSTDYFGHALNYLVAMPRDLLDVKRESREERAEDDQAAAARGAAAVAAVVFGDRRAERSGGLDDPFIGDRVRKINKFAYGNGPGGD